MCVTGNKTIDSVLVIGATIAVAVVFPPAGPLAWAALGAGSGAALAGAQERDPLTGAIIGGITGGITGGMVPPGVGETVQGSIGYTVGQQLASMAPTVAGQTISNFAMQQLGTFAIGTVAGGVLGAMMPGAPTGIGYTPVGSATNFQQVRMNTNIATTGSGGRQAATSLAAAISRTKKRKLTQDDVGDLSLSTESFTNTGLQLA